MLPISDLGGVRVDRIFEFTTLAYGGEIVSVNGLDREIGWRVQKLVKPKFLPISYLRSIGVKHVRGAASTINSG